MDIIERAARAVAPMLEGGREFDQMPADRAVLRTWARQGMCGFNDATQDDALELARAVLSALREPDEGMIEAGTDYRAVNPRVRAKDCWQAMIDQALKG